MTEPLAAYLTAGAAVALAAICLAFAFGYARQLRTARVERDHWMHLFDEEAEENEWLRYRD